MFMIYSNNWKLRGVLILPSGRDISALSVYEWPYTTSDTRFSFSINFNETKDISFLK